jgi:spoIIIJ-associated protein
MTTNKKYFSGNSIEQAILQAARHFKIDSSEVAYRQVERRHGFLKTRRRAVIEVDVDNPRLGSGPRGGEDSGAEPVSGSPVEVSTPKEGPKPPSRTPERSSRTPTGTAHSGDGRAARGSRVQGMTALPDKPARRREPVVSEVSEAAREAARRLCVLGNLEVEVDVFKSDDGIEIEVRGADEGEFIEDRGRLLLAMQHLMPRLLRGLTGETVPCRVDCDNFQEVRAEQLRVLAQKVATEVRERGRAKTLEPMSPDERRIVHMTLADDQAVETESQGTGLFKRVRVIPANRRGRTFEPYKR